MRIVETAVQSVEMRIKKAIENIGVKIPAQTNPISEVISGSGEILPRPRRPETLRIFGAGSRRAMMRFALQHPERVVKALNPADLDALREPLATEAAFHQQWAEKVSSDAPQDFLTPKAERVFGIIEFKPDDRRIEFMEKQYGLERIKPKISTDQSGRPVMVEDLVRSEGRIAGGPDMPVEIAPRTVFVPDIAGAIGAKNAKTVIAALGLVDPTKGEETSVRQAAVRQAVVEAAGEQAMGLTPKFVKFTVQAFLSAAENPELRAREVVSALFNPKK